jgi:aconitate decarboxylase
MDTVSEPKGVTGELVEWIDGLELTSVPHEIKTRLKHLILDGIACSLVGARCGPLVSLWLLIV